LSSIKVPTPTKQPSSQPSQLTQVEIAQMTAAQRNVFIYERQMDELRGQVTALTAENSSLSKDLRRYAEECGSIEQLKRGKTELYVSSLISTIFMAVGGGLISSYPITADGNIPWQFATGWTLLGMAILFVALIRPIVWIVYYKFVKKKHALATFLDPVG
jgi:hypothetical protein